MSILDIDNMIVDETVTIQNWLDTNCEFIGCYPEIHNNIVDVKIDIDYAFQPILKIETNDSCIPTDLFRFGECEYTHFKNGKIRPIINLTIYECPNLKTLDGIPDMINLLYIRHGKSLNTINGLPRIITKIDIKDCVETNFKFVEMLCNNVGERYKIG